MSTLGIEIRTAFAQNITVTEDTLVVDLDDGRTISVPLAWIPRLLHGTPQERNNWRFVGWPDLDEDIGIEGIVFGKAFGESQRSFKRWLDAREKGPATGGNQQAFEKNRLFLAVDKIHSSPSWTHRRSV